ncbi:MAG: depupylase/deamidase Dop [Galactobacter sp.]|uniref:depupylase/deamidase Dop n=1 Tax=Galactobacter sp. TaxID=2676125 RepID=UPI0025BDEE94|nr:depupylase/deamidase Dop [Galactobacter sp.]
MSQEPVGAAVSAGAEHGGRRIMGLETEFGVLAPGAPDLSPSQLSAAVTTSMVDVAEELGSRGAGAPWDYISERPLEDARGFSQARDAADPTQLTDQGLVVDARQIALEDGDAWAALKAERDVLMNLVLGNGARFYVDHAHPEYSSPETSNSLDATTWDLAGDRLASRAATLAGDRLGTPVLLHKNNTDGKGASYGAHENYLVPRELPFQRFVDGLTPFFVSRQVTCGAGRVGLGRQGERPGFQLSQRGDFFEKRVGLETTIRRPLINTRDEPHSDDTRFRRLHVIIGDANLFPVSTLVRTGSTSLVLRLIEDGLVPQVSLADPVGDLSRISHDPTCEQTVVADGGRRLTGLDLQELYLEAAEGAYGPGGTHEVEHDAERLSLSWWRRVVDALRSGSEEAARWVEWRGRLGLLQGYLDRGLTWDSPKLTLIDLQWADLRPGKGLANALLQRDRAETLVDHSTVEAAMVTPPADTRAWTRGKTVTTFPDAVVSANWDTLAFTLDCLPQMIRVGLPDPWKGGEAATKGFFDPTRRVQEVIGQLRGL